MLKPNHDFLTEGSNDTEKSFLVCVDVMMNPDIATGIDDTNKHILSMQVDSTIKFGRKKRGASIKS